jgi:hypothetical protein
VDLLARVAEIADLAQEFETTAGSEFAKDGGRQGGEPSRSPEALIQTICRAPLIQ